MLERIRRRVAVAYEILVQPGAASVLKLERFDQSSAPFSLATLLVGAFVMLAGVSGFSSTGAGIIELVGFSFGLALGMVLWASVAYLYARLLGGRAPGIFWSFLYFVSSVFLFLLLLAISLAYVPLFGPILGLGLIFYGHVLILLIFHHLADIGLVLSVLGTVSTTVVTIGLFQLLGRVVVGLLTGTLG
ncbi:MAG: hypothetical protein ACLFWD_14060 [Anaerolineales bacterium]